MKIIATCQMCLMSARDVAVEYQSVHFYDDRTAQFECQYGHRSTLLPQQQKFEILMESGGHALLSGFTMEACNSFSAALERTYEFGIRVMLRNRAINENQFDSVFETHLKNASERQLGAFLVLYLQEFGEPFNHNTKLAGSRNKFIHQGCIPTPDEAKKYCSDVYKIISDICSRLEQHYPEIIDSLVAEDLWKRSLNIPADLNITTAFTNSGFNLLRSNAKKDFPEALAILKSYTDFYSRPRLKPIIYRDDSLITNNSAQKIGKT